MDLIGLIHDDPLFFMTFAGTLLGAGMIAGILAGLLGVGGGIVIVPVLFLLFPIFGIDGDVLMHLAVGTSLATIVPTSIVSARSHHKKGGVDWALLKSMAPAIFVGALGGAYFGTVVKGEVLTLIFAVIAMLVAVNMAVRKDGTTVFQALPTGLGRQVIGLLLGGFSVVMGIGGGTLGVPTLTAFNYPIRRAIGTASAIGLVIAVPGSLVFIVSGLGNPDLPPGTLGYAHILAACLIVPATMLMAPVGAKLAHIIQPRYLRWAFAVFLLVTSLRMFYRAFT